MSTYSLTLRQRKGRRLSISEVDNNWLYLQELALSATGSGGGGSGGTVSGLTESYGVTYSGYLITDWCPVAVIDIISGSFAPGDSIVGLSSSATADILNIIGFDGGYGNQYSYIYLDSVVGSFNDENISNLSQSGLATTLFVPYGTDVPYGLSIALTPGSGNSGAFGNIIQKNGTQSYFFGVYGTQTPGIYDILISWLYIDQFTNAPNVIGILGVTPATTTVTYSTGLVIGDSLNTPGGNFISTGLLTTDGASQSSFMGLMNLQIENFISDPACPIILNSNANSANSILFSNFGIFGNFNSGCKWSSIFISERGFCFSNSCNSCCCGTLTNVLGVDSNGAFWNVPGGCFYLPTTLPDTCGQALVSLSDCGCYCIGIGWGLIPTITCTTTLVGYSSGRCDSGCNNNVFIGDYSGYYNTCGSSNVFIGSNSGYSSDTGNQNTFIGACSGACACGCSNTYIGYNSGASCCVSGSIAIGHGAQTQADGDFALGSCTVPLTTGSTADSPVNYLCVIVNGEKYKLPLYN
jgi:hypothetical protein